jgi:DNA-binding transcriptional LysR family regulator
LTTDAMSELAGATNDLAILYSLGEHPSWTLTRLLAEELTPVAAPAYLERAAPGLTPGEFTLEQVLALDLYDYDRVNAYWVTLREWFQRLGQPADRVRPRVVFSSYAMAVEAALRGNGVILGSRQMLVDHLCDGSLVKLTPEVLRTGYGYYIGLPRAAPVSAEALRLYQWLVARAAEETAGRGGTER